MTHCCAIATYDHKSGNRTLCHLNGSNAGSGYYEELANEISENTTVIVASGTDTSSEGFEGLVGNAKKKKVIKAMKKAGKDTDKLS